jgi:predicted CXXCH cytochrome family protein
VPQRLIQAKKMLSALRSAALVRSADNSTHKFGRADMRRVESTARGAGCRVLVSALVVTALVGFGLIQGEVAMAANPNPHVSTYVPVAGTVVANVNTDSCAGCHRAHTANSALLLPTSGSQSALCFTCHDGTGASSDVQTEFASAPQNNPSTGSYYRHDATAVQTSHTVAVDNEFGGVLNRHSECTDCHNPHAAADGNAATPAAGVPWPSSARIAGISYVTVDNTTNPRTFGFVAGTGTSPTFEYQLCFKCHSNFTNLPVNTSGKASQDFLDAAAEFDPANASFHPIEAQGKNQTAAMVLSLSTPLTGTTVPVGTKDWTFSTTATVRCTNCHADNLFAAAATTPDANLPSHTSSFRGILAQNYNDRTINGNGTANKTNFALCFMCHTDASYVSNTATNTAGDNATNFKGNGRNLHRFHVSQLGGGSGNVDTPGSGSGNALCAECHFRPHSTKFPTGGQSSNQRLVSFSPNITASQTGQGPSWVVSGNTVTCTLTCHGQDHDGYTYPWKP